MPLGSRYQPDGALERRAGVGERDYLSSEEGESDLTESESHLNMLKGGSSTLQAVLHPPASPSEHSSSVVNMSVGVLGKQARLSALTCAPPATGRITRVLSRPAVLLVCVVSYLTTYHVGAILALEVWVLGLLCTCLLIFTGCIFMVCRQPQTSKKVSFMVCSSSIAHHTPHVLN